MTSTNRLAQPMGHHAVILFPPGLKTFHISMQCVGTEIIQPRIFRSPVDPIVIHHSQQSLQLWANTPTPRRVRIVLVDYRIHPRQRTIFGHLWFGTLPGDMEVSDFSLSLAAGIFPEILKDGTIYVLGVRFGDGPNQTIPLTLQMCDVINGLDFSEKIELVYVGGASGAETQFIRANAAISKRAQKHSRPDRTRYLPGALTQPQIMGSPQTVKPAPIVKPKEQPPVHPWLTKSSYDNLPIGLQTSMEPRPSTSHASNGPSASKTNAHGTKPPTKTTGTIPKEPSKQPKKMVRCHKCDWEMAAGCYDNHQRVYHRRIEPCPICDIPFATEGDRNKHAHTHTLEPEAPTYISPAYDPTKQFLQPNRSIDRPQSPVKPRTTVVDPRHPYWTEGKEEKMLKERTPVYPKVPNWPRDPKYNASSMWGKRSESNEALPESLAEEARLLADLKIPAMSEYGSSSTINTLGQEQQHDQDADVIVDPDSDDEGNASVISSDHEP